MDSNITNEVYKFPVEVRQLYFPVKDKFGNIT